MRDPLDWQLRELAKSSLKRDQFRESLASKLLLLDVELGSITIGRNKIGRLWIFGVYLPSGKVMTFEAPIADAADATSEAVATDIAMRVKTWLSEERS